MWCVILCKAVCRWFFLSSQWFISVIHYLFKGRIYLDPFWNITKCYIKFLAAEYGSFCIVHFHKRYWKYQTNGIFTLWHIQFTDTLIWSITASNKNSYLCFIYSSIGVLIFTNIDKYISKVKPREETHSNMSMMICLYHVRYFIMLLFLFNEGCSFLLSYAKQCFQQTFHGDYGTLALQFWHLMWAQWCISVTVRVLVTI